MFAFLRSLVNAFLGKVPGKAGRDDTGTRMWRNADFSDDCRGLVGTDREPLPAVDPLEELDRLLRDDRRSGPSG